MCWSTISSSGRVDVELVKEGVRVRAAPTNINLNLFFIIYLLLCNVVYTILLFFMHYALCYIIFNFHHGFFGNLHAA
jgi:hypothetical protein